jgi:hypothetical protein
VFAGKASGRAAKRGGAGVVLLRCAAGFWWSARAATLVLAFGAALLGSGATQGVGIGALVVGLAAGVLGWVAKLLRGHVGELAGAFALGGLLSGLVRLRWRQ